MTLSVRINKDYLDGLRRQRHALRDEIKRLDRFRRAHVGFYLQCRKLRVSGDSVTRILAETEPGTFARTHRMHRLVGL